MGNAVFSPVHRAAIGLLGLLLMLGLIAPKLDAALADSEALVLDQDRFRFYLGEHVRVLEDPSASLTLADVESPLRERTFKRPPDSNLQFGYRQGALWLSVTLINPGRQPISPVLEIRYPPLDRIDVYLLRESTGGNLALEGEWQLGDHLPYTARPIDARFPMAPLDLKPESRYQLLIRVQSDSSLAVPLYLSSLESLYEAEHDGLFFMALFYGVALGLFLYNLFLYLIIRERMYLQYVLFVLGYTLFMASLDGFLHPLWPEAIDWESRSIYIFPWICGVFLSLFCRNVLQTPGNAPLCDRLLQIYAGAYAIGVVAFLFLDISLIARINSPMILLNALTILGITIVRYSQGHPAAGYFMVGMGSFCIGLISVAGGAMNLLGHYDLAPSILKVGACIEMILFSIALAQRISSLQARHEIAQREARLARAEAESQTQLSTRMQEANQHLQLAMEAKTRFLASMSHEIRTPMNGVLGMLELMRYTPLKPEQRQFIEVAHRSGHTLLALINDILDYSKIESGRLELERIDFNLRELLSELQQLFSVQVHDKGLTLDIEVAEELPVWIRGDRTRLWQILNNLIGNAIKFTSHGGVRVRGRTGDTPDRLRIEVIDTGIGISTTAQERIFEAFTQADSSTTRQYGGTGLGLTISRRLAELMGGTLSVESRIDEGSTFSVDIPLVAGNAPAASENTYEEAGVVLQSCAGLRVLVVEDNRVNQMVARGLFEKLGISPVIAEDGMAAVSRCDTDVFDLIFMDLHMPNLDGLEATRRILDGSSLNRSTPIIAMTADSMEGDREKCLAVGMKDYGSKPIQITKLRQVILRWGVKPSRLP